MPPDPRCLERKLLMLLANAGARAIYDAGYFTEAREIYDLINQIEAVNGGEAAVSLSPNNPPVIDPNTEEGKEDGHAPAWFADAATDGPSDADRSASSSLGMVAPHTERLVERLRKAQTNPPIGQLEQQLLYNYAADELEAAEEKIKQDAWVKPKLMEYRQRAERAEAALTAVKMRAERAETRANQLSDELVGQERRAERAGEEIARRDALIDERSSQLTMMQQRAERSAFLVHSPPRAMMAEARANELSDELVGQERRAERAEAINKEDLVLFDMRQRAEKAEGEARMWKENSFGMAELLERAERAEQQERTLRPLCEMHLEAYKQAQAEISRLREALEEIVDPCRKRGSRVIARAALGQ